MFETTFPDSASAQDSPERSSDALRAFDWAELVARISATNDLRRVVNGSRSAGGFASFHVETGRLPAAEIAHSAKSKRAINPDGLGDGKHTAGKGVDTTCVSSDGDRED